NDSGEGHYLLSLSILASGATGSGWVFRSFFHVQCRLILKRRQHEKERGALAWGGFDPDTSAMALNNLPADCQTHSRSRVGFLAMQPLKHAKDSLCVLGVNPNSIILYSDDPRVPLLLRPQMNPGRL